MSALCWLSWRIHLKRVFDLKRMLFIVPEATFGGKGGNKVKWWMINYLSFCVRQLIGQLFYCSCLSWFSNHWVTGVAKCLSASSYLRGTSCKWITVERQLSTWVSNEFIKYRFIFTLGKQGQYQVIFITITIVHITTLDIAMYWSRISQEWVHDKNTLKNDMSTKQQWFIINSSV